MEREAWLSGRRAVLCWVALFVVMAWTGVRLHAAEAVAGWAADVDAPATPPRPTTAFNILVPVRVQGGDVFQSGRPSTLIVIEDRDFGARPTAFELWDTNGGRKVARIPAIKLNKPAVSPDGAYLAGDSGEFGNDAECQIWSFRTGQLVRKIQTNTEKARCAVTGFGAADRVVTHHAKGFTTTVCAWEIKTGKQVLSFELDGSGDVLPAISPGGKYLAAAGKGLLRIYDLTTGKQVVLSEVPKIAEENMRIHESGQARGLAFSPDGTSLAGVFDILGGCKIVVWDMATGQAGQASSSNPPATNFNSSSRPSRWPSPAPYCPMSKKPKMLAFFSKSASPCCATSPSPSTPCSTRS